ncbi:hypothetical protein BDR26DRAFT_860325 [Obelidium mucronatum]|nr:hypothetical protein BDR26DRAFT_860325 [Obelidium mucronatum]
MTTPNPMSTSKKLAIALSQFGLDICVPFHAEFYNEKIREGEQQPHLPSLSPTGNTLSLLIANSRLLWTKFTQHIIENPGALDSRNPLDDYVRTAIDTVIEQELDQSTLVDIRFAYDRGPKFVAFQKLAHAVGEAYYNQQAFLCSHPRFGPWQALRGGTAGSAS